MSDCHDIDSPDYNDTNLGDPRMTPDEKEIERLEKQVASLKSQLEHKDKLLKQELSDWAETDTSIRESARKVLGDYAVDGDTAAVPPVEDIVEKLVAQLEQAQELLKRARLCYYNDPREPNSVSLMTEIETALERRKE
jgi:hypothetical protein